ncbi:hypothetical protein Q5P01_001006 [Channa striata]|uniref:Uncharacterized protein n=1 Tax=Channa striata TaxID=64152 RepID=A0AA88IGW6_CHASR|nr:hypothetical protein Q5P01_001006 [Channa striata]
MSAYRGRLMKILSEGQKDLCKQSGRVSIPALAGDMPGQEHEITCVSLVIVNSHLPKPGPGRHRKKLIVVYNKRKVNDELHPEVDHELATGSGVESASRIAFYPCSGELALLEKTVALLHRHGVELLYVYNAEFDVRVMEQRVHFYAGVDHAKGADPATRKRCSALLGAWRGLFVTRSLSEDLPPFFQFESVRYLEMYRDMLTSTESCEGNRPRTRGSCGSFADVAYSKMDEMIHRGGKSLFAVLLYNLVDSQLCARLTKALRPVSALFHRCRITLNIDVVVHGRGDTFGGFVQSIHSVQMPQLKYVLDKLRAKAGPAGKDLGSRARWDPKLEPRAVSCFSTCPWHRLAAGA